ncbi:MAG: dihydropteroate synthase [Magnetococcales bacterium]|nr:dihydropteroate synthase [Magnetococcales bacterium]MBF0322282.1 dihydropteroate synthase [Magnetococcales bacterium]
MCHATGRLLRGDLEAWIERLASSEARSVALALHTALTAHGQCRPVLRWHCGGYRILDCSRPLIMGVINVTPDSFSDGGRHADPETAVAHGIAMVHAGAHILDVGGESTRPGAQPVSEAEEMRRVIPVVQALASSVHVPISIDTSKATVMSAAMEAGASLINDVTALRGDPHAARVLANTAHPIVLMHMQGAPGTMQHNPSYRHVVAEVYDFFTERIHFCQEHGIKPERLILDPGIGFGKTTLHNLELIRHLRAFYGLGLPLLLGVSRKTIVGALTGEREPAARDPGSQLLAALGALSGAHILRVHDVAGTRQSLAVAQGWRHNIF